MVQFTSDQWIIISLVFVLGLLIGMFLTAGSRRKWKSRYKDEVETRQSWQAEHARMQQELERREQEWRERDSLRAAALKDKEREREPASDDPHI
jgi:hypothetical protein